MVAAVLDSERGRVGHFHVWMTACCALVAFGASAPTYWLQLSASTFAGPPLLHVHAVRLSAWTLLLLSQALLAANGPLDRHRAWGLARNPRATAMVVIGAVHPD